MEFIIPAYIVFLVASLIGYRALLRLRFPNKALKVFAGMGLGVVLVPACISGVWGILLLMLSHRLITGLIVLLLIGGLFFMLGHVEFQMPFIGIVSVLFLGCIILGSYSFVDISKAMSGSRPDYFSPSCCASSPGEKNYDDSALYEAHVLLEDKRYPEALAAAETFISLHESKAREMQDSLTETPWESKEKIFSYTDLNDIGLALFLKAEALQHLNRSDDARRTYEQLSKDYSYAQCWCPEGWFVKLGEAAFIKLEEFGK